MQQLLRDRAVQFPNSPALRLSVHITVWLTAIAASRPESDSQQQIRIARQGSVV